MNKKNIYLLYAVSFLQGMVFYAPIATLYRQNRGVDIFQITLIESCSLALCLLLEIPWGVVADRIGYKNTLLFCNILYVVSKIVFWQAHGFTMFLVERLMLSVVCSGLSGCDIAMLYLSCGKEESSQKVFGVYSAMATAGLLAAAGITPLLLRYGDSQTAFFTILTYGAAAVLTVFLTNTEKPVENLPTLCGQMRELFQVIRRDGRFLPFLLAAALFSECRQTILTFLNQLQYVRCSIPPAYMGFLYILITVAGLFAARAHRLTRRFGENRVAVTLITAGGLACLILTFTVSAVLSVLCLMTLQVAFSVFVPIQQELQNRRIEGANRASVLSVYAILMDSVAVFTNLAFGRAADFGVANAMLLGAAFCFIALLLYFVWLYAERKKTVYLK